MSINNKSDEKYCLLANQLKLSNVIKKNSIQQQDSNNENFGLKAETPIYTLGVEDSEEYLNRLCTVDNKKLTWIRDGSISVANIQGIVDMYTSYSETGDKYSLLYLNIYGNSSPTVSPKGHKFVGEELGSGIKLKPVEAEESEIDECYQEIPPNIAERKKVCIDLSEIREHLKRTSENNRVTTENMVKRGTENTKKLNEVISSLPQIVLMSFEDGKNIVLLENSNQVEKLKAFDNLYFAAENGHIIAQFLIGTLYFQGRCIDLNYINAHKWYLDAAHAGLDTAQNELGKMYLEGIGVERDISLAESWFTKSARNGNVESIFYVGTLMVLGVDHKSNPKLGYSFIQQSARLGYQPAIEELIQLGIPVEYND